jgi:hypothetical protein
VDAAANDSTDLASRVAAALGSADLDGLYELLDPNVRWAAPGDDVYGCHNRDQVVAWYSKARRDGARADVIETVEGSGGILVGLSVHLRAPDGSDETFERWQVLRIRAGLIVDIRGYDERADAAMQAGVTTP